MSLAIWDHTVLPVTQHKWTYPTLTPPKSQCSIYQPHQRCLSFFGHLCRADTDQDHSRALGVLPKTGDEELEDRGKPGWERLRMICAHSTLAWRWQDGALWIDRHGIYLWMRLRPRDTLQRERERERRDGRLSWPRWLATYQDGFTIHRWFSPIQLLTASARLGQRCGFHNFAAATAVSWHAQYSLSLSTSRVCASVYMNFANQPAYIFGCK